MNIFRNRDMLTGIGEAKAFATAWEEFIRLAKSFRQQLGDRRYLLDRYLLALFDMRHGYVTEDALDAGKEAFTALWTAAMEEVTEKGLYPQHKEAETKAHLCTAALADRRLKEAAQAYMREQAVVICGKCDIISLDEQYAHLCACIGREDDMAKLNDLFARCFLSVNVLTAFVNGFAGDLLYSLCYRDIETDHTILQLLLEE